MMPSSYSIARLVPVVLASSFVLVACNKNPEVSSPPVETASNAAAVVPPMPEGLNDALSKEKVNVTLSLEGQPRYLQDEDVLLYQIKVANSGLTTLVGTGTKPVYLAAQLIGPEGADKAPGLRDFVSVPLPQITSGEDKVVEAKLPAEALKGQTVQFQLLQGGVAWFDAFGQAPLNLGAYSRCEGAPKTLCDSGGTPVSK